MPNGGATAASYAHRRSWWRKRATPGRAELSHGRRNSPDNTLRAQKACLWETPKCEWLFTMLTPLTAPRGLDLCFSQPCAGLGDRVRRIQGLACH